MCADTYHLKIGQQINFSEYSPGAVVIARFHGGFGEVYVLQEEGEALPKIAAKTPRLEFSGPSPVLEQFAREATVWMNLPKHPNILPAYDVSRYNGQPYVRMKFVAPKIVLMGRTPVSTHNQSIEHTVRQSREELKPVENSAPIYKLPSNSYLSSPLQVPSSGSSLTDYLTSISGFFSHESIIASQLLDVLTFLEKEVAGFIHGDIKPENMLVEFEMDKEIGIYPKLLLSDFGLARSAAIKETGAPLAVGDLFYMAPETFGGVVGTKAQDIYAVGCTLYKLITGENYHSIDAKNGMVLRADTKSKQIQTRRPDIPSQFIDLIFDCLKADPLARPSCFVELQDRYMSLITKAGGKTSEVTGNYDSPKWLRDIEESEVANYLLHKYGIERGVASDIVFNLMEANNYAKLGLYSKSEELIERVLATIPNFAPALACQGYRLTLENKIGSAVTWYALAVNGYMADRDLQAADKIGYGAACATLAQLILGNPKSSSDEILFASKLSYVAIELLPSSPKAYRVGGLVLLRMRKFEEAYEVLKRAYDLDPSNRGTLECFAATRFLLAKCKPESIADLKRELGLDESLIRAMLRIVKGFNLC